MSERSDECKHLRDEISSLQQKLQLAEDALAAQQADAAFANGVQQCMSTQPHSDETPAAASVITTSTSSLHTLLLLADSALPLGSFAFSAGLESYLAHHRSTNAAHQHQHVQLQLLHTFLPQSLLSLASTSLPYVLAAWREPRRLTELDDAFDASVICTVARRASTSQGRALLGVWERSFRQTVLAQSNVSSLHDYEETKVSGSRRDAINELKTFGRMFKLQPMTATSLTASPFDRGYVLHAHLGPLWGVVNRALDVDQQSSAYLYLFSHARTVISAAVRAGVLGPYQAQAELASTELKCNIEELIQKWWHVPPEDAAQVVPIMDMWVGRHEKLYSRIFNS